MNESKETYEGNHKKERERVLSNNKSDVVKLITVFHCVDINVSLSGLDPASPLFNLGILEKLSPASADFVDVIHTSGGTIGMWDPMGHVDFYPNGGDIPQPGCFGLEQVI